MNIPLYNITKNGKEFTKAGEIVWNEFIKDVKWVLGISFFEGADSGELTDLFSEVYPHLRKMDMYNAIVALRA